MFERVVTVERTGEAQRIVAHDKNTIVLVVRGHPRAAVFSCPCGCSDPVLVTVDPAIPGSWRLHVRQDCVTLMPSVWRNHGCYSHFMLWQNEVHWCDDRPTQGPWPAGLRTTLRRWWRRARRSKGRITLPLPASRG